MTDKLVHVCFKRKNAFYGYLLRLKIQIFDAAGTLLFHQKIRSGKKVECDLPPGTYTACVSYSFPLLKRIEAKTTLYAEDKNIFIYIELQKLTLGFIFAFLVKEFSIHLETGYYLTDEELNACEKILHSKYPAVRRVRLSLWYAAYYGLYGMTFYLYLYMLQDFTPSVKEIGQSALKGTDAYTIATYTLWSEYIGTFLFILLFLLLIKGVRARLRNLSRKRRPQNNDVLNYLGNHLILYLRAFGDDTVTRKNYKTITDGGFTEEEALVSVMYQIAPVVAIGRPSDKYLPEGAHRIYVEDAVWQENVISLSKRSRYVILRLGETEGLLWEINYCLSNIPLEKLIFIIPRAKSSAAIANLQRLLGEHGLDTNISIDRKRKAKSSILGFCYFRDGRIKFQKMLSNPIWNFFVPLDDLIHDTVYPLFNDKLSEKKSIIRRRAIIDTAVFIITSLFYLSIFGLQFYLVNYRINNSRYPTDLITLCDNIPEIQEFSQRHTDKYTLIYLYHYYEVGSHYADPEEFRQGIAYKHNLLASMSDREFELMNYAEEDYYTNYTILAKKYLSDTKYFAYKRFLRSIIKIGIAHQDETIPQYELPEDEELLDAFQAKYDALEIDQVDFDDIHEWHQLETDFLQIFLDLYDEGYDATPLIRYWYQ